MRHVGTPTAPAAAAGPRGGGGASDVSAAQASVDESLDDLQRKLGTLKHLAISVREEARTSVKDLDSMGDTMTGASGAIAGILGRMDSIVGGGSSKHMVYVVAFVVGAFLFIYFTLA